MGHRTEAPTADLNGRQFDIERTLFEFSQTDRWRAEYFRVFAGQKASKKQRTNAIALVDPDITDAAYRLLSFRLLHCNEACENYWGSTEREAGLLDRSAAAIERASKGLEGRYQKSTRRRHQSSMREFDVSEQVLAAARELLPISEAANVRVEDGSEPAQMRFESPEPANLPPRSRKNEGITYVKNKEHVDTALPRKSLARKIALPDGYRPRPETWQECLGDGWTPAQLEPVLKKFGLYQRGKGSRAEDWDLVFLSWLSNEKRHASNSINGSYYKPGAL